MLAITDAIRFRVTPSGDSGSVDDYSVEVYYEYIYDGWHESFPGFTSKQDAKTALKEIKQFVKARIKWESSDRQGKRPALAANLVRVYQSPPKSKGW